MILLSGFTTTKSIKYDLIFPDDYSEATEFIKNNSNEFKNASFIYRHGFLFSTSIVFPEIMRYSVIKDIIETAALELVYVNNGSDAADFSVGRFQMKPSFIESIEKEIIKNDSINNLYSNLLLNEKFTDKEKRKIRLERLKNNKWQIIYLHAFISICDNRFKDTNYKNENDKLTIYATAYNSGFYTTAENLIKKSTKKCFPYGEKYEGTQYAYSDIANYYYTTKH